MRMFRLLLLCTGWMLLIHTAEAQSISFSATTPRLVYSSTSGSLRVIISGDVSGAVVGSMKLKFKFLKDSSSAYYADMQSVTYTVALQKNSQDVTLALNPSRIGSSTSVQVNPPILYATLTEGSYTNFLDTSVGFRKGKYDVTAEYTRVSNSSVITSSVLKWSLQHITLPPKILSPAKGSVTKGNILFKDLIYDSTVLAGTKQLAVYRNADRMLVSTITLSDDLKDSVALDLTNITAAGGVVSVSGTTSLSSDTYKLVLSYQDRVGHAAASDSTVVTLKREAGAPILYTAKNTIFNAKNPTGPISYMLPDSASVAFLVLRNLSEGSGPVNIPVPTANAFRHDYNIDPSLVMTDGQYEIKVAYRDYLLNSEVSVVDTVFFQRTTPVPVISYPSNWQTMKSPLIIKDTIPGTVLPGSKKLVITGTSLAGVSNTITFQLSDARKDSVYYDCVNDPTANGTVLSMTHSNTGSTVLPDGNYAITLSYRDQYGNAVTTGAPVNFILKTKTNTPSVWTRATMVNRASSLDIRYTLPDAATAGSTVLVLKKGAVTDSLYLQPQPTAASQAFTWLTNTNPATITGAPVASASPALPNGIADGTYQVSLAYKDQLGNAFAVATGEDVIIRNSNPAISASGALEFCNGDSVILTSSASNGNKWFRNNTALDTAATQVARVAGVYKLANASDNYASMVDSVFVTLKSLPNPPVTQPVSYYVQDTINTALVAEAAAGHALRWYGTSSTGGTLSATAPVPRTSVAGTASYYVSQLNNTTGCESSRSAIVITTVPLPPGVDKNGRVGSKEALQKNGKIVEVIKTGN